MLTDPNFLHRGQWSYFGQGLFSRRRTEPAARIRNRFPDLDLALPHLGGTKVLGVLLSMDHRQGADLTELLRPARVVPIHYDDYGLFHSPLSNFLAEVRDRQPAAEVRVLNRGDTLPLTPVR